MTLALLLIAGSIMGATAMNVGWLFLSSVSLIVCVLVGGEDYFGMGQFQLATMLTTVVQASYVLSGMARSSFFTRRDTE